MKNIKKIKKIKKESKMKSMKMQTLILFLSAVFIYSAFMQPVYAEDLIMYRYGVPPVTIPFAVAVNPATGISYVANNTNDVGIYNFHDLIKTVHLDTNDGVSPVDIAINPVTNKIYVLTCCDPIVGGGGSAPKDDTIFIIDGSTNDIVGVINSIYNFPMPTSIDVNPITNKIYVTQGEVVTVIDGASNALLGQIPVGKGAKGVIVRPTDNRIFVANSLSDNISVIDGSTDSVIATSPTGSLPVSIAVNKIDPNDNTIYVANRNSNQVEVFKCPSNCVGFYTIPAGEKPTKVVFNPKDKKLYIANLISANIYVVDGLHLRSLPRIIDQLGPPRILSWVRPEPHDMDFDIAKDFLYVTAYNNIIAGYSIYNSEHRTTTSLNITKYGMRADTTSLQVGDVLNANALVKDISGVDYSYINGPCQGFVCGYVPWYMTDISTSTTTQIGNCSLVNDVPHVGTCNVDFTPSVPGSYVISGNYLGDDVGDENPEADGYLFPFMKSSGESSILTIKPKSGWPMFGHDPIHTGVGEDIRLPVSVFSVINFDVNQPSNQGYRASSPSVSEGKVYIGAYDGLYTIDPVTFIKFKDLVGQDVTSSPSISDGVVYASSVDGLSAIDIGTHTLKWKLNVPIYRSSPLVYGRVVYIGSTDENVYAINADSGAIKWKYSTGGPIYSSPAISNGVIYIASDNDLYAIDGASGVLKKKYPSIGSQGTSPTIVGGKVYAVSFVDGNLNAIDEVTGDIKWNITLGGPVSSSPAVSNGVIYIGSQNNVYAIEDRGFSGTIKWKYVIGGALFSSPTISNGIVYVGSSDNNIYAIDTNTGTLIWKYELDSPIYTSPAIANGALYIASDNKLYAFAPPLYSSTGKGDVFFITNNSHLENASVVSLSSLPRPPAGVNLPYGVFKFKITGVEPGGSIILKMKFPNNLPVGTSFWKFGPNISDPTPHWYKIPSVVSGMVLSITFTDGGVGDADLKVNGEISDDGGPSIGEIRGTKFEDINGNGIRDKEDLGLKNWVIKLTNETGNISTNVTDENGNYTFENVADGDYIIEESLQPGWIQTVPNISEAGMANYSINIKEGNIVDKKDFGNFKLGEIYGTKFEDLDANGIMDNNETNLSGWNIRLKGVDSLTGKDVNLSTQTDINGSYSFKNLSKGTYTISEELQNGWVMTLPNINYIKDINISRTLITDVDFGNFHKGKIIGGGWISITEDPKATFGISSQYSANKDTATGSVEYQDHKSNLTIKSIQINTSATTLDKKKGAITGLAQVNGNGSYPFVVYVEDNGETGKSTDVFKISLLTYPYSNGAVLSSGNIQIHE